MDARWYQVMALSGLFALGSIFFDFPVGGAHFLAALIPALCCQYYLCLKKNLEFQFLSPLISVLSIVLLMRANAIGAFALAGLLAVVSKFVLRWGGKHLFNPTNFAICSLIVFGGAWVSPGQWGHLVLLVIGLSLLGIFITGKVQRLQMSCGFLVFFFSLVIGRAWFLGDPMTLAFHQLKSGSLYIFAFYMLSDPRTTPNAPVARLLFAFAVALSAYILRFHFYRADGIFFALLGVSCLTPLFDIVFKENIFYWNSKRRLS